MRDHTLEAMPYKGEVHQKAWGHKCIEIHPY